MNKRIRGMHDVKYRPNSFDLIEPEGVWVFLDRKTGKLTVELNYDSDSYGNEEEITPATVRTVYDDYGRIMSIEVSISEPDDIRVGDILNSALCDPECESHNPGEYRLPCTLNAGHAGRYHAHVGAYGDVLGAWK